MKAHTSLQIWPSDTFEEVTASCQTFAHTEADNDGHLMTLRLGDQVSIQASGDGTARVLEFLDVCRSKVEAAHQAWLKAMAAKAAAEVFDRLDENLRNGDRTADALRHAVGVNHNGEVAS